MGHAVGIPATEAQKKWAKIEIQCPDCDFNHANSSASYMFMAHFLENEACAIAVDKVITEGSLEWKAKMKWLPETSKYFERKLYR